MENTNQETVKLQVKPYRHFILEVVNDVKEWVYEALNSPYYKAYDVLKEKGTLDVVLLDPILCRECTPRGEILWERAELVWDPSTKFTKKWVEIDREWTAGEVEVTEWDSHVYGRDFQKYLLKKMDWVIVLSNWKFLMNKYGKYEPNLSFLSRAPEVRFEKIDRKELNFDEWDFSAVYWEFFISKKWTKCFRILPKERAKHILICDSWWWAFEKYRWRTLPEDKATYYRRASSNWWWCWCDYWVYDVNFKNEISEEDI